MNNWRLLVLTDNNAARNMAVDEAILVARSKGIAPNTLRFFGWKPAAITIGYFQSLEKEVDAVQASRLGVDVVRRYTGGGAVFHDKEVTYSVALAEEEVPFDIIESYRKICGGVVVGLRSLGIDAQFHPINDIVTNGKKLSGSAQTRRYGTVLQHGTILLGLDIKKMFSLLKVPDEKVKDKMMKLAEQRVTSVEQVLGRPTSTTTVQNAVVKGFETAFNTKLVEGQLTDEEKQIADELYRNKYSNREWNHWR